MLKKKVSKKDKIRGLIFIIIGVIAVLFGGPSAVRLIVFCIGGGFIIEGIRIRNGKKSILFEP